MSLQHRGLLKFVDPKIHIKKFDGRGKNGTILLDSILRVFSIKIRTQLKKLVPVTCEVNKTLTNDRCYPSLLPTIIPCASSNSNQVRRISRNKNSRANGDTEVKFFKN